MSLKYFYKDLDTVVNNKNILIKLKWLICSHTLHLVFFIRLGQSLAKVPIFGIFFRVLIEYLIRIIYASDISLKAKIGYGLIISHGHDIVIGADVTIGNNCKIFNGVTLGNKDITLPSKDNQPKIGNNVVIATGAKILGPICVGNSSTIGANAVVITDIGDGETAVGIPAKCK
ncbi:serine O-acetyltransferase [Photorhabdus australis]|uniref:serine O-acetyltransferase n=1 Tax=Photorhabdus australis TaxID=286156 RepID=UPI00055DA6C6|nr:serine acetyltransferase [Photorhabdus australis]